MSLTNRCRARDKKTCAYHGNPLRAEDQATAIATADTVYKATSGTMIDYGQTPALWNTATIKRFAHLLTAYDSPTFTRDILKAKYDMQAHAPTIEALEDHAGSLYRQRMRDTERAIWNAKTAPFPLPKRSEAEVVAKLHALQFQAEWEADQHRRWAADASRSRLLLAGEREQKAADEIARSLAARAQAFRINQLCENMKAPTDSHPVVEPTFTF